MNRLKTKFKEAFFAVFPLTVIVVLLGLFVIDLPTDSIIGFIVSSALLIVGMALFTIGIDNAIMPIGELIGSRITRTKKLWFIFIVSFFIGLIIAITEPGLTVLSAQLSEAINPWILLIIVGVGVGIFLILALAKIIFDLNLNRILMILYGIVFAIAIILTIIGKSDFIGVGFDAGGAVTGAITVPFIMAFGIGIATIKGNNDASDSFGLICLCCVGPIMLVMLLGAFSGGTITSGAESLVHFSFNDLTSIIFQTMSDVFIPLLIITAVFMLFQIFLIKTPKTNLFKILIGILFTYVGLVIFLVGANGGFTSIGKEIGYLLADYNKWLLIPVGLLIGFFLVVSEPAIQVLGSRIEEISDGRIKRKTLMMYLMCGVGVAIALAMIRIITGISIFWILVPGYIIAFTLSFLVPKIFTALAFDSGGVASGPMTAAFLLPLGLGACSALGGDILHDAFGLIAFVSLSPLITIQILGLISNIKARRTTTESILVADDFDVIELEV